MKKTIRVIGEFQVKPEFRDQFKNALKDVVKGTSQEPGCLSIRLFEDKNNPSLFFGYQEFENEEAVIFHRAQPYEVALANLTGDALVIPQKAYVLANPIAEMDNRASHPSSKAEQLMVIAIFDAKQGQRDTLVAQYEKQIPNVRNQDTCIDFNAYPVVGSQTQLIVMEQWQSPELGREFSMNDELSKETGQILFTSLVLPIPEYIHELEEIHV